MVSLGIDIGTTNIAVFAFDLCSGEVVESYSTANRRISGQEPYGYLQDPDAVERAVRTLLSRVRTPFSSIGVTGQVHGILYYDKHGRAVSPLYTWLDQRGSMEFAGVCPQKQLHEKTGWLLPPGYGLLTHYTNMLTGSVPEEAVGAAGILEYITGRLTGTVLPATDASSAATFGGFDPVTGTCDPSLLETAAPGMPFPRAAGPFELAGVWEESIPVALPVGDNQAGFFGVVSEPEHACMISIGTSGQLSVFSRSSKAPGTMELRPYLGLGYLHVGASLSAGKSYEVLHRFIKSVIGYAGRNVSDGKVFDLMKEAAAEADHTLEVCTAFSGTRQDPAVRGAVTGISLDNFTLGNLVQGTVDGIVGELWEFTHGLGEDFSRISELIATGSSVKKNHLFPSSLQRIFQRDVRIAQVDDGAAAGAALISAAAAGLMRLEETPPIIQALVEGRQE